MPPLPFQQFTLPGAASPFAALSDSIHFVATGKGRWGNQLVQEEEPGVPLVRTTTAYSVPPHRFSVAHQQLAELIRGSANTASEGPSLAFNHALIEIYERSYTKMKFHSDQCLDVAPNSYIALYSCYENPEALTAASVRKLKIQHKTTQEESELLLTHNSVVLFSVATNTQYLHKIVLEPVKGMKPPATDNRWLGLTFRQSDTFLRFQSGAPHFANGTELTLASELQRKEFYRLRGEENRSQGHYAYPDLAFTISPADRMVPVG